MMKTTKHLIHLFFVLLLTYAPYSYSFQQDVLSFNVKRSSRPACDDGTFIDVTGYQTSKEYCEFRAGQSFTPTMLDPTPLPHFYSTGRSCQFKSSGTNYLCFIGVSFAPNPSNSNCTYGVCTCKTGYKEEGQSCVIDTPPPTCTAPEALDPVTGTCQLTACPVGSERVSPSTSCTPIVCSGSQVPDENGICNPPPCPNRNGQQAESFLCNQWNEEISGCKYPVANIKEVCTTQYIPTPPLGLLLPLRTCKNVGTISESNGTYTIPGLNLCEQEKPPSALTVNLKPLTPAEKAAIEAEKLQRDATLAAQKAAQEAALQAAKAAQEAAKQAAKTAAQQATAQAKAQAEAARLANIQAQNDARTAAAQLAQTNYTNAQTSANTAQSNLDTALANLSSDPTNTSLQQAASSAASNSAQANQAAAQAGAIAAQQAASAAQTNAGSGAGSGGFGGSGNSSGGTCGDLSCEETQKEVEHNTDEIRKLLSGEDIEIAGILSPLTQSANLAQDIKLDEALGAFDDIEIINKLTEAFSSILPISPWELIKNSETANCQFDFNIRDKTYTMSICEALPIIHPALAFVFFIFLVIAIFNLIFERPTT